MSNTWTRNSQGDTLLSYPSTNASIRPSESIMLSSLSSLNPVPSTRKQEQQILTTDVSTLQPQPTTLKNEMTTQNLNVSTHTLERTTLKTETTTQKPEVTTLQVKPDLTTDGQPTTTHKYNFTLVHETWPTVFYDAKLSKRVKANYPSRNKTILTQPQVMPQTMSSPSSSDGARYLVYLCEWGHACGGLGDRQRTIVSLYVLSRLVNRRFSVKMSSPCDIANFYVPFKVQWSPPADIEPSTSSNTIYETDRAQQFTNSLTSGDFNAMHP